MAPDGRARAGRPNQRHRIARNPGRVRWTCSFPQVSRGLGWSRLGTTGRSSGHGRPYCARWQGTRDAGGVKRRRLAAWLAAGSGPRSGLRADRWRRQWRAKPAGEGPSGATRQCRSPWKHSIPAIRLPGRGPPPPGGTKGVGGRNTQRSRSGWFSHSTEVLPRVRVSCADRAGSRRVCRAARLAHPGSAAGASRASRV